MEKIIDVNPGGKKSPKMCQNMNLKKIKFFLKMKFFFTFSQLFTPSIRICMDADADPESPNSLHPLRIHITGTDTKTPSPNLQEFSKALTNNFPKIALTTSCPEKSRVSEPACYGAAPAPVLRIFSPEPAPEDIAFLHIF